jgi:hypothetical protein
LSAGKVDAHFANNGNLLQDSGIGRIILSTRGKPVRFKYRAELWGTRAFIERYPELTVGGHSIRARFLLGLAGRQPRGSHPHRHPQRHT